MARQAFSGFLACLIFIFVLKASIFQVFCLPRFQFCSAGKHFPVVSLAWASVLFFRQAFPKFFACLVFIFVLQASIFWLSRLPGLQFCSLGKRFSGFMLAWISVLFFRQALSGFSACLDSSFVLQANAFQLFCLPGLQFCSLGSQLGFGILSCFGNKKLPKAAIVLPLRGMFLVISGLEFKNLGPPFSSANLRFQNGPLFSFTNLRFRNEPLFSSASLRFQYGLPLPFASLRFGAALRSSPHPSLNPCDPYSESTIQTSFVVTVFPFASVITHLNVHFMFFSFMVTLKFAVSAVAIA